jgi:amidase/aspartyl-tRNA(Asn)/glutamyl-tRNA(Gln) amidotransferase subunit A
MTGFATPLGALDIARAIADGTLSAVDVVERTFERIAAYDERVNAFTTLTRTRALSEAARIDAMRARHEALPPLAGVPYAVKNLFDIEGVTTLAGSRVLADAPPAERDAVLVDRMSQAGAVLVGALNMDEFAYGFTTENHHYGACRNPHDLSRTAGGSSGGSAAAVAAGFVPLTLGSDTNGSVRVPASFCGIFGIKPTYGRLSRRGSYPFVASLDHTGAFARNVDDLIAAYHALQWTDAQDPACAPRPIEPVAASVLDGPLRVARLGGYFDENAGDEARAAALTAAAALDARDTVTFDGAQAARGAAFVITASEGGQLHLPHLRSRYEELEPLSRDRFVAGALLPAAWSIHAQRVRALLLERFVALFRRCDVLVAPATPVTAPRLGEASIVVNGRELPARASVGLLTQPISLLGLPVVVAPLVTAAGKPLGVQLIAPPWREDLAFAAARRLERLGVAYCPTPPAFQ